MGFNVRQPGKVNRADIVMLACAIVVFAALIIWATR